MAGCARFSLRQARKIILLDQRFEVQAKLRRGSFDADTHVGDSARDAQRHGDMRLFDVLCIAPKSFWSEGLKLHQTDRSAGCVFPEPDRTVDEAQFEPRDVRQFAHFRREFRGIINPCVRRAEQPMSAEPLIEHGLQRFANVGAAAARSGTWNPVMTLPLVQRVVRRRFLGN